MPLLHQISIQIRNFDYNSIHYNRIIATLPGSEMGFDGLKKQLGRPTISSNHLPKHTYGESRILQQIATINGPFPN